MTCLKLMTYRAQTCRHRTYYHTSIRTSWDLIAEAGDILHSMGL